MRTTEPIPTAGGVTLELPNDPRAAARARRAVDALEGRAHPETLAKARLLVTELVAASIGVEATGDIQIRVGITDGTLRGEISTEGHDAERLSGWGLLLVRRMSDDWGSDAPGSLWFEVADRPRRFARTSER